MAEKIQEHASGVAALKEQVDAVIEGVESLTDSARDKLARYQQMKEQTELLLDEAGREYEEADELLSRGAGLAGLLGKLRSDQRELDREAGAQRTESIELEELRAALSKVADDLRELKVYNRWGLSAEEKVRV